MRPVLEQYSIWTYCDFYHIILHYYHKEHIKDHGFSAFSRFIIYNGGYIEKQTIVKHIHIDIWIFSSLQLKEFNWVM